MKRLLPLLLLLLPVSLPAQTNTAAGNLTAASASCLATNCVTLRFYPNTIYSTITLSGTWSATVQFEVSGDFGITWVAAPTTTSSTSNGTSQFTIGGYTNIRARVSAFTSGTVAVTVVGSTQSVTTPTTIVTGGGISSVTSLPATCTPGVTAPVQLSVAPFGIYYCSATNVWSVGGISASGVIDTTAPKYATPIAKHVPDATFTSGQATIDCTFANDCNFTSVDGGSVCFGTNFTNDISILNPTSAVLPEGVLTVTDAQHATCSGGNSTATTVHNGVVVWGKLGHTQLNSAWTDCLTQAASGGCNYQLPPGPVLVEAPVGITNPTNPSYIEGQGYGKIHVRGWGASVSQLIPTPNFSGAACIGGPITGVDNNGCFFSGTSINMSDWGIFGAGQANLGAGFNGKIGIIISGQQPSGAGANSYLNNLDLFSWGATTTGFTGIKVEGQSDTTLHDVHLDGMGATGCLVVGGFNNTLTTFEGTYCAVTNNTSLNVTAGEFTSHGGVYGWTNVGTGTGSITCGGGSGQNLTFFGDTVPYQTGSGGNGVWVGTSCKAWLNGVYLSGANSSQLNANGGTAYIRDSSVVAGSATGLYMQTSTIYSQGGNVVTGAYAVNVGSGTSKFFDEGFNSYTGTTQHVFNTAGSISGPNVLNGSATGTCTASATLGLYGLGQFAALTCTSTVVNLGQVMDRAGTLFGVTATSTANGVSGVVTVLKNGAATSITCSLAGVQICTDFALAHATTYVAGDVISVQVATGAAETLANVKVGVFRQ